MYVLADLSEELCRAHELAGAIGDSLHVLLPPTVVLKILVLYVVAPTNHKHICLQSRRGGIRPHCVQM